MGTTIGQLVKFRSRNRFAVVAVLAAVFCEGVAADGLSIPVSPLGDDNHTGMHGSPVRTLAAARKLVKTHVGKRPVEIVLEDGDAEVMVV